MALTKWHSRRVADRACSETEDTLRPMPTATMEPSTRMRSSSLATSPASSSRCRSASLWSTAISARLM